MAHRDIPNRPSRTQLNRTLCAGAEMHEALGKSLQRVLRTLHFDDIQQLLSGLIETDVFLDPWIAYRDHYLLNPAFEKEGLYAGGPKIDELLTDILNEVKQASSRQLPCLGSLTSGKCDSRSHTVRVYSSLIVRLADSGAFYKSGSMHYFDWAGEMCRRLYVLVKHIRGEYAHGHGTLIDVIENHSPCKWLRAKEDETETLFYTNNTRIGSLGGSDTRGYQQQHIEKGDLLRRSGIRSSRACAENVETGKSNTKTAGRERYKEGQLSKLKDSLGSEGDIGWETDNVIDSKPDDYYERFTEKESSFEEEIDAEQGENPGPDQAVGLTSPLAWVTPPEQSRRQAAEKSDTTDDECYVSGDGLHTEENVSGIPRHDDTLTRPIRNQERRVKDSRSLHLASRHQAPTTATTKNQGKATSLAHRAIKSSGIPRMSPFHKQRLAEVSSWHEKIGVLPPCKETATPLRARQFSIPPKPKSTRKIRIPFLLSDSDTDEDQPLRRGAVSEPKRIRIPFLLSSSDSDENIQATTGASEQLHCKNPGASCNEGVESPGDIASTADLGTAQSALPSSAPKAKRARIPFLLSSSESDDPPESTTGAAAGNSKPAERNMESLIPTRPPARSRLADLIQSVPEPLKPRIDPKNLMFEIEELDVEPDMDMFDDEDDI